MSELKLPAASGGGSISIKGPSSSSSDVDLLDTSGNLKLSDSDELRLGTGDDLKLYHNGTESYIKEDNNHLIIRTVAANKNIYIQSEGSILLGDVGNSDNCVKCIGDGAVELYHDGIKTFNTIGTGIQVRGGEGLNCELFMYADEGDDNNDLWKFVAFHTPEGTLDLYNKASGSWEKNIGCFGNGAVELYHDNSKKLETISTGVNITGGIRLGGNNSANEMDDYEEGTFTPRLGGASNIGTYNVTGVGAYVKIGNMVTVTFHFYDKDLDNSADGAVYIDQMPFTSKNGSTVGGISDNFHTEKVDFMEDRRYTWYISGNDTKLKGLYSTDGSGWANWQVADFESSGMYIEVQCSYMTE